MLEHEYDRADVDAFHLLHMALEIALKHLEVDESPPYKCFILH